MLSRMRRIVFESGERERLRIALHGLKGKGDALTIKILHEQDRGTAFNQVREFRRHRPERQIRSRWAGMVLHVWREGRKRSEKLDASR
jgi:hypothetical protein